MMRVIPSAPAACAALALLVAAGGCAAGGAKAEGEDSGGQGEDSGGSDGGAAPLPLDPGPLDAALDAAWADRPAGLPGLGLVVIAPDGARLYEGTRGALTFQDRLPVASASKLVSALVQLRLVTAGALQLEQTTAAHLGWTGPEGAVTIDQLHAFTSGLSHDPTCLVVSGITLADCAEAIRRAGLLAAPGETFAYGGGHQQVAGAIVEEVTGQPWNDAFRALLAAPLGLTDPGLRYVTLPQRQEGESNPLVAGGLLSTGDEYLRVLQLILQRGEVEGAPLIDPALLDRLHHNPYPDAEIITSPLQDYGLDYGYGFGAWRLCPPDAADCAVVSAPGAFGATPWFDRDRGYAALLLMDTGDPGGARWAVPVEEGLRALIEAQLDAR